MCKVLDESTRALVKRGQTLSAVPVVNAEFYDGEQARVLLCGVDTVYFSFMTEISDAMWERLQVEQNEARIVAELRDAKYAPDWLGAVIAPHGAKGGYHFLIEHEAFSIKLLKGVPNRQAIYVEMRAFGLHVHPGGVLGACEGACAFIRDVLLADCNPTDAAHAINLDAALCSRLDLHCDWQGGWSPTYSTGEDRLIIKPARVKWKPEMQGNTCTGYRFGSGKVQARIYNKTLQTVITHCAWYSELLKQRNGLAYNPTLPVWRLEFQLLRDGVKGFKLYAKPDVTDGDDIIQAELDREDLPHIGSVRKALHWAGHLWGYLSQRWLRLVEPGEDGNRARWGTHPTWQVLQAGFASALVGAPLAEDKAELVRKQRHTGYERFLHRIEVGVLALVDAQDTQPAAVAHAWLAHLAQCLKLAETGQQGLIQAGVNPAFVRNGMGMAGAAPERRFILKAVLDEVLGLFTGSGVAKLGMRDVATVGDLLSEIADDPGKHLQRKGRHQAIANRETLHAL